MSFLDTISRVLRREVLALSNIFPKDSGVGGAVLWVNPGTVEGKKLRHGPVEQRLFKSNYGAKIEKRDLIYF